MGTKTFKLILIASSIVVLHGQTQIDLRTQSKRIDFSGAQSTKPIKAAAVLPATCVEGEMVLLQTAVPGRNVTFALRRISGLRRTEACQRLLAIRERYWPQ
jgi:hypothetical protein